jgi:hypothetical protein
MGKENRVFLKIGLYRVRGKWIGGSSVEDHVVSCW